MGVREPDPADRPTTLNYAWGVEKVVQAGTIHGGVHLHPSPPRPPRLRRR